MEYLKHDESNLASSYSPDGRMKYIVEYIKDDGRYQGDNGFYI